MHHETAARALGAIIGWDFFMGRLGQPKKGPYDGDDTWGVLGWENDGKCGVYSGYSSSQMMGGNPRETWKNDASLGFGAARLSIKPIYIPSVDFDGLRSIFLDLHPLLIVNNN